MAPDRFPRGTLRKLENPNFPLVALGAVREIRDHLDDVEDVAIRKALDLGAGAADIAEALGITRQGAYYKMRLIEGRSTPRGGAAAGPHSSEGDDSDVIILPETSSPRESS